MPVLRRSRPNYPGFTLVELLVALFITAIMFAMGYRTLDQAFTSRKEVEEQATRLLAVQQAMRTLEQDFELLQPRPVRQLLGDGYQPALTTSQNAATASSPSSSSNGFGSLSSSSSSSSSSNSSNSSNSSSSSSSSSSSGSLGSGLLDTSAPLVTLTRGSWTNPVGIQRPELQRVSYLLANGTLTRQYWPVLDATIAVAPHRRVLIDHVKTISFRFMDAGHQWRTDWPATALGPEAQRLMLRSRPVAVEITLELEDWGKIVRLIEVAG